MALAVVAAYSGSFQGPFVFDDLASILANPTLHPVGRALFPPARGITVSGRPLLNWSLALNYALGGTNVVGYHVTNLAIHVAAALVLFGCVRRTVARAWPAAAAEANNDNIAAHPTGFAFIVTLLWALHPLQTESVTYVVQRAESLMGLFYLLTLYGFIRFAEAGRPIWSWVSVAACALGMLTKEVMITAPALVLLYDRTFVAGSFRSAWQDRRRFYTALAATWLVLAALLVTGAGRGGAGGFAGVAWWDYGLTQLRAMVHYLGLVVWPQPLVFDYGAMLEASPAAVWPQAIVVIAIAAASAVRVWRGRASGFLGAWFLVILLPSSSVIPIPTETISEHRMYLSLAAVITLVVGAGWRIAPRYPAGVRVAGVIVLIGACLALGCATFARNQDYRSARGLWSDSVAKWPANARAHNNLGMEMLQVGELAQAEEQYRTALRLQPGLASAQYDLTQLLPKVYLQRAMASDHDGQLDKAAGDYRESLRLNPDAADAWYNLGNIFVRQGHAREAADAYQNSLRLRSDFAPAHVNFGGTLLQLNQRAQAIQEFETALRLQPQAADVRAFLERLKAH